MNPRTPKIHSRITSTRREFVREACCGFGGLALASLLHDEQLQAAGSNPLAAKPSHVGGQAKSVIFLFMAGGPSHVETFDPKPLLNKLNGQRRPDEFGEAKYQFVHETRGCWGPSGRFANTARAGSKCPTCFRTQRPASTTSPCCGPVTATAWFTRPRSTNCSPAASCLVSPAWVPGCCMAWVRRASRCPRMS